MPLKPKNPSAPPRGMRWIYKNQEDGYELSHLHYDQLRANVRKYRNLNQYPIGSNFEFDFDQNVCGNADPNDCEETDLPSIGSRVKKFAKALTAWGSGGFKRRTPEEINTVMEICEGCPHFKGSHSVFRVGCGVCGCGGLRLHMASEKCPVGKW